MSNNTHFSLVVASLSLLFAAAAMLYESKRASEEKSRRCSAHQAAARSGSAAAHQRRDGAPPAPVDTEGAATGGLHAGRPGGCGAGTGGPAPGLWAHESEETKNWMDGRTERYADGVSRLHVFGTAVEIGDTGGAARGNSAGPHLCISSK